MTDNDQKKLTSSEVEKNIAITNIKISKGFLCLTFGNEDGSYGVSVGGETTLAMILHALSNVCLTAIQEEDLTTSQKRKNMIKELTDLFGSFLLSGLKHRENE